jgi:hypothetical protein
VPQAPGSPAGPPAVLSSVAAVRPRSVALAPFPAPAPRVATPAAADAQKLRNEILRLEFLVKKLQAELEAEHQYCAALEAHFKNLQETR